MARESLADWGFDSSFAEAFRRAAGDHQVPARVTVGYRRLYDLITSSGLVAAASLLGRYVHAHEEEGAVALPAVGDWVVLDVTNPSTPIIHDVLPRRSAFLRTSAGRNEEIQVVAANVDTVFLVNALDSDLNPRRVERYLTLAHESGVDPVILLNKADLCEDTQPLYDAIVEVAGAAPVHVLSAKGGVGIDELRPYLEPGKTVALMGSSGVGKSTLVNRFFGESVQKTRGLRADGRGRHTTTNRYLFRLPSGGLVLDTPGMRELHLTEGEQGLEEAFADIIELGNTCRFRDCAHGKEPGCAARAAVKAGKLDRARLEAYAKLAAEQAQMGRDWESRKSTRRR